jgi:chromosome segregation ATPase
MNDDDPTRNLPDESDRTTQPSITALFELVRAVKQAVDRLDHRLDETNARIDETNARITETNLRIEELDSRMTREIADLRKSIVEGFRDLSRKINIQNRNILQSEADQEALLERIEELESKAS